MNNHMKLYKAPPQILNHYYIHRHIIKWWEWCSLVVCALKLAKMLKLLHRFYLNMISVLHSILDRIARLQYSYYYYKYKHKKYWHPHKFSSYIPWEEVPGCILLVLDCYIYWYQHSYFPDWLIYICLQTSIHKMICLRQKY